MFQIEPKTLKDYVSDNSIRMPRFQRSEVWKEKQKFDLMLSICKQYPIGSVILCCEENESTSNIDKWLIDGRQRHSTVKQIMLSPDLIYSWAKKTLHLKSNPTSEEIRDEFFKYLEAYTNYDKNEHEDDPESIKEENIDYLAQDNDVSEEEFEDFVPEEVENVSVEQVENEKTNENENQGLNRSLRKLLDLLVFCKEHKDSKNYGLTQVFNFRKYIKREDKFDRNFILPGDSKNKISGEKIRIFINAYKGNCESQHVDYKDKENFLNYIDDEYEFKDQNKKTQYKETVLCNWSTIQLAAIQYYEWTESLLSNSYIGVISVSNASSADEQKIFSLINTNGTPLTAAQILSAKPAWNQQITNIDSNRKETIKQVYDYLHNKDVDLANCVKWDLPASLFLEIKNGDILFPFSQYKANEKKIGKAITLGFKILSGIYLGRVTKDAYDDLSSVKQINTTDFSEFVVVFNEMLAKMGGMKYFATLASWKLSLSTLIGENAATYFTLAAYHMYTKGKRPSSGSTAFKFFEKNLFITLDNLIYEYLHSIWRGSSDSLLAQKIKEFKNNYKPDQLCSRVAKNSWINLVQDVMQNGTISKKEIKFDIIKPLVAHYYCIKGLRCNVNYDYVAEFDHIIPQKSFNTSGLEKPEIKRDSVFNVGLLPKSSNAAKNDRSLNEITGNATLINAVITYEEIERAKFDEFSSVLNWKSLRQYRGKKIKKAFEQDRENFLIE